VTGLRTRNDPRLYQIAVLGSLLTYGLFQLEFEVTLSRAALLMSTVLVTQYWCTRLWRLPAFDPRSALISGLSLCLMLRTNSATLAVLAAIVTIASKFALRINGKHVFNPTNFGIVALLASTGEVWVSPGQWGSTALLGFLMACLGGLVVNRAARSDVTFAFLFAWGLLVVGRSIWLGDPLSVPFHRLANGSVLLFAFFMISDPKTTPNSRTGRILFAMLVALGAYYVQYKLFRTNGLLWSLAACSPLVPLIDRLMPGGRYDWFRVSSQGSMSMNSLKRVASIFLLVLVAAHPASAFCGFYVAKADAKLFNRASQVVLVRDGDRTVMTMANDFKGELKEFAIVIPVPTPIQRDQINVGDKTIVDHLDAYSAPRLVEYFDENPCRRLSMDARRLPMAEAAPSAKMARNRERDRSLGVTIEAQYTVGEYDILILSAKQSGGLATWLKENGYRMPEGAAPVLGSYIKQNMRFFVARVNLKEQAKLEFSYLRPIQVAYESPKFMLPIRLGTLNANGTQELYLYTLTRKGRVETTNYRTVKLPTGMEIPTFVKTEFGKFYGAMFGEQVRKQDMRTVFVEYSWDMAWCDPCAADPLSNDELRKLGVFWLDEGGGQNVFLTRLHARYDGEHFPDDLVLQQTADRENFQGRYVLRHPWTGGESCEAADRYRRELRERQEREAQVLASLTGWDLESIRKRMPKSAVDVPPDSKWWQRLWK
jgi:Na+-translocating ferredoxin:NAD+ oxidoreductase RnfD subunit